MDIWFSQEGHLTMDRGYILYYLNWVLNWHSRGCDTISTAQVTSAFNNKGPSVPRAVVACVRTTGVKKFFDIQSDWTLMTYAMEIAGHMEFYFKHNIFCFLEYKARGLKLNTYSP